MKKPIHLAVSALCLSLSISAGIVHAQQVRNDEAIAPSPEDPHTGEPEDEPGNETQDMFDRNSWINVRFAGPLDKDFFLRTMIQIQNQAARHPELLPNGTPLAGTPRWRSIGPVAAQVMQNYYTLGAVDSGRVRTILPHPTDPNTLYLLSAGGGLWKTSNFNSDAPTWTAVTDSTVTTSGGAVAFGRSPDTLYLGLGDPFDGIALVGGVMLRSTDGGTTWSAPVDLPTAGMVTDVKVDTSSAAQDIVMVGTNAGLYRSTDGGQTYALAAGIPSNRAVSSIVRTSAGWLAATFVPNPSYRYGIGTSGAMYLSTDGGATFAPAPNNGGVYSNAARTTLGIGQAGDAVLYAIANVGGSGTNQRDMFRSADGGLTWAALGLNSKVPLNPNGNQPNMNIMHDQAWYNQMVLVDPADPTRNTVYFGGNLSSAKTTDGGATWTVLSNWLAQFGLPYVHADFHAAAASAVSGHSRILFGSDGGLFVSDDDGRSWTDRKNLGLVDHLMYSLTTSGADASSVLSGLQDNGTRLRIDGNGTFNQTYGGDGFGVGWSQANGGAVLGSYVYNRIYYATHAPTDQNDWTDPTYDPSGCFLNGIDACNAYFYTTVYSPNAAADPSGKKFFARSFYDVWRTDNGGQLWTSMSLTDPNRTANSVRASPHVVGVHPTDINRVAAGASGGRVRITTNGGVSWVTRAMPGSVTAGFNANVAWINNTSMYVASENVSPQPNGCWLAKTTDLGATWQQSCTGLPQVPISKVLVSPADPTGMTAYAATWIGVYRTINGGRSWDQFGAGLPVVKVSDLYMPAKGGFLRVATYGRGIWEIATPR